MAKVAYFAVNGSRAPISLSRLHRVKITTQFSLRASKIFIFRAALRPGVPRP
jgi:hypothetical protein